MTAIGKSINFLELTLFFIFFLTFLTPLPFYAQHTFTGCWGGKVVQLENGVEASYPYEICLNQHEKAIKGVSYIRVGEVYAEMELTGTIINGNYLRFKEVNIIESENYPGSEWCLKSAHLLHKTKKNKQTLEGVWQAKVSFGDCTPGTMRLERKVPQA